MSSLAVVDAHALIWFLQDDPQLGRAALAILEDPGSRLGLPAIALAECCLAIEKRRSNIPSVDEFLTMLRADKRFTIVSINKTDALAAVRLVALHDLHDRLIVAVAMRYNKAMSGVLLTGDFEVQSSKLVPIVW